MRWRATRASVIMDEPTSSLSGDEVERLFGVIRELTERGVGVVYISHRLDEIFEIADRITVMRDGAPHRDEARLRARRRGSS